MICCSAIKRKLSTVRGFTPDDRRLVLRAWLLLLPVDLGLRLLPFQRLAKLLGTGNPGAHTRSKVNSKRLSGKSSDPVTPAEAGVQGVTQNRDPVFRRVHWALDTACRNFFYPVTCLRRSLVLQVLLNHFGIAAELHLGVRKEGDVLEAHAWLEYQGCPIAEPEAVRDRFKPMTPMS